MGSVAPGVGTAIGAIAGGAAAKYGCDRLIEHVTDYGIKKISEKIVKPQNTTPKPDLKNKELYYENAGPYIEKASPKYYWETSKDSTFPVIKNAPNQNPNLNFNNTESKSKYKGYKNPLTNDNRIFTREDIGGFSTKEYSASEPEIMAQWSKIGIPTNGDLELDSISTGGTIFVQAYARSDGTRVKAHYRAA